MRIFNVLYDPRDFKLLFIIVNNRLINRVGRPQHFFSKTFGQNYAERGSQGSFSRSMDKIKAENIKACIVHKGQVLFCVRFIICA